MQGEWDSLEEKIKDSFEDTEASPFYTEKLINKLHMQKKNDSQRPVIALSFIAAGLFMMFIYTSNLEQKFFDIRYQVACQMSVVQYEYHSKLNQLKNMLGE